ncbi:hypothetical protein PV10_02787 [Exophiala mesophila]|uniref:DUF1445 domain-containing protein n=1 Tax=Exophiala mesophila TaxID=212818 RepID=A0A0D1X018_EXOME|nr:uncharacterized protein PV10_02787 [Exophiala mesophila]KIV95095.1 hypothetical protein PV10_02787 [Exophiala mesophila]
MPPIAVDNEVGNTGFKAKSVEAPEDTQSGQSFRREARAGRFTGQTAGAAPSYVQANLIVLPSEYASDFRLLCQRNPVPCPLLAESKGPGIFHQLKSWTTNLSGEQIANDIDLRNDFPKYMVYEDGKLTKSHCADVEREWTDRHVGFLVGCSFSFEGALAEAGLSPVHVVRKRNVSMYRTKIPLCPAGVFQNSTYIVSMRPYKRKDIDAVRSISRPYVSTHGEPIDWGWDAVARLGIEDLGSPAYGDAPVNMDGSPFVCNSNVEGDDEVVPVFWGCGVTPQEAIQRAGLAGTIMAHAPGHMTVLDIRDWDIIPDVAGVES